MPLAVEDVLALHDLYSACDQLFDDRERLAWIDLFTEDTVRRVLACDRSGRTVEIARAEGRGALGEYWDAWQRQHADVTVRHFSSRPLLEGDGAEARGRVNTMVACDRDGALQLMSTGRVDDELVKQRDAWRFRSRTIRVDATGGAAAGATDAETSSTTAGSPTVHGQRQRDEADIRRLLVELSDAGDRYDAGRATACFHPDGIESTVTSTGGWHRNSSAGGWIRAGRAQPQASSTTCRTCASRSTAMRRPARPTCSPPTSKRPRQGERHRALRRQVSRPPRTTRRRLEDRLPAGGDGLGPPCAPRTRLPGGLVALGVPRLGDDPAAELFQRTAGGLSWPPDR